MRHGLSLSLSIVLPAFAICTGASAQDAKSSAARIKAVTEAVDGNAIRANAATSKDWPTIGLDYAETRFSKLDQINAGNVARLGLAWSYSLDSARGVEATPLVVDGIMFVTGPWSVVHAIDARTGKKIWTFDPEVARDKGYRGCCDVVNRGVALYKGKVVRRRLRRPADRARRGDRQEGVGEGHGHRPQPRLHHHRRAAGRQRQGDHRQRRRRVRRARLCHRLRRRDRQAGWRWFTVPGDPSKPFEDDSMATAAKTWDPPASGGTTAAAARAWDTHRLRSRAQPALHRHRQRLAVEPQPAQPGRRRQPLSRLDRRAQRRHRQVRLALPGDAGRQLGLHVDPADDPGRPDDRRRAAQGDPARAEERLLLRDRSHQRQAHLGPELRRRELGDRLRRRTAVRSRCPRRAAATSRRRHPRPVRRAQLASDVVQSADRAGLPAGAERAAQPDRRPGWTHNGNKPGELASDIGWNLGFYVNATRPRACRSAG